GKGPSTSKGVRSNPSISTPSSAVHRIVRTWGKRRPSTIEALNDVALDHPGMPWSKDAISGGSPCAWWVVHTPAASGVTTHAGVVTASPMNAAPSQRSSRRPSSQILPHAEPVPSVLAYQSDAPSHQAARPTVWRSGQGSVVAPSARSITFTLPDKSPWSLAYPSTTAARIPSGDVESPSICQTGS